MLLVVAASDVDEHTTATQVLPLCPRPVSVSNDLLAIYVQGSAARNEHALCQVLNKLYVKSQLLGLRCER